MRSSKASWKNGKRVSPMRIKPRNKYWTYLLTLNGNGARYPCINRSRHAHAEIHIHRWKGEVEEGEQYLESTRIERSRRVLCHQYTWSMYIPPFHARVFLVHESAYTHTRAYTDDTHTHTRVWAHMRARHPRLPELREAPDGNCPPLSLSPTPSLPSLFPEGQICIHTTSHTTRFNISGHGWKLSPETQADVPRGTIGLANAAIFAIAPVSGVSRRKRDC